LTGQKELYPTKLVTVHKAAGHSVHLFAAFHKHQWVLRLGPLVFVLTVIKFSIITHNMFASIT
jgi:hypothetical protein